MLSAAITCLALNIYHEARSEPIDGQVAVAVVTLNRVASNRYPNDICGVVWQNKQFSWTHDGKSDTPKDKAAWNLAKTLAEATLDDPEGVTSLTGDVLHYHADYTTPFWARNKQPVAHIGSHIFYGSIK